MGSASKTKKKPFWKQLLLLNFGVVIVVQIILSVLWMSSGADSQKPEMLQTMFTIVFLPAYLTFINYTHILNYRKPADVVQRIAGIMLSCIVISCLFHYIRWSYRAGHGFVPPLHTIDVVSFEAGCSLFAISLGIGILYFSIKNYYRRHAGVIKPKKEKLRRAVPMDTEA